MATIISNFANDIIEYKNNLVIDGGPALFIEKYFKDNSLKYNIFTGENKGEVLILNNNGDDVGLVKYAPQITINNSIKSDYFIISTLINEFDLSCVDKLEGLIFCDIQGYIRELNSLNRILIDNIIGIEKVDFLKVADYEFQFLTNNFVNNYIKSGGNIIVTTGGKGIIKIIYEKGEEIINIPTGNFDDTLGAGDTFLASFADIYFKTKDIKKSIIKSSNYVYDFLINKNINI